MFRRHRRAFRGASYHCHAAPVLAESIALYLQHIACPLRMPALLARSMPRRRRRIEPMNKIATAPRDLSTLEALESTQDKITVLNPAGYQTKVTKKTAALQLESIAGTTIYL